MSTAPNASLNILPAVKAARAWRGWQSFRRSWGSDPDGGALTGLEGAKTKDGYFLAFHDGINDGLDRGVNNHGDVGLGELGASCNQIHQVSFVHWRGRAGGGDGAKRRHPAAASPSAPIAWRQTEACKRQCCAAML